MNPDDIKKAEIAADGLYDRERKLAAIVVICDLNTGEMRVIGRAPNRRMIARLLFEGAVEATVGIGGETLTIQSDDPPKGAT